MYSSTADDVSERPSPDGGMHRGATVYPGHCRDPYRGGYQNDPQDSIDNLHSHFKEHPNMHRFLLPFSRVHSTAGGVPTMAMQKADDVPFCTDGYVTRPHKVLTGGHGGGLGLTAAEHIVRDGLIALIDVLLTEYEKPSETFCYYTDVSAQNFGVIDGRLVLLDIESMSVECTDGVGRPGRGAAPCGRFWAVPGVNVFTMLDLTPRETVSGPGADVYPPLHRVQTRQKFQTIVMLCALVNNIDTIGGAQAAMGRSKWFSLLRPGPMDVQQAVDAAGVLAHATNNSSLVDRLCRMATAGPLGGGALATNIGSEDTAWAIGCADMNRQLLHLLPTMSVGDVDSRDAATMKVVLGGAETAVIGQGQYGIIALQPGATCVYKFFRYVVGGPVCMYCVACRPGAVFHYCHDCGMAICFRCWGGRRPSMLGIHLPLCTRYSLPNV